MKIGKGKNTTIVTLTLNPAIDKSSKVAHVIPDRKLYCEKPSFCPGGGGLNVARAIHKLGGRCEAYLVSGGPTGQILEHFLDKEGIKYHVVLTKDWTRENLIVLEEDTNQQFRFGMPGPLLLKSEWKACLDKITRLRPRPGFVIGSGSLPEGVPDDFYARLTRAFKKTNTKVILDISGRALKCAVGKGAFMIKMNLNELGSLVGHELKHEIEYHRAASSLINKGACEILVVSLGAAGALLAKKGICKHLRAPLVQVKSVIGAGDSMVGGIVLGLTRGYGLEEAMLFGIAAGTAAVMTPGTGLSSRKDAEKLFRLMREGRPSKNWPL